MESTKGFHKTYMINVQLRFSQKASEQSQQEFKKNVGKYIEMTSPEIRHKFLKEWTLKHSELQKI